MTCYCTYCASKHIAKCEGSDGDAKFLTKVFLLLKGSHGIPSAAARSLPMLNRSQSNAKQSPHHKTSLPSRTRPTPHQVASPRTSTTTGSSSPRKAASASLFTSSPQNETIVEDSET